MQQARHRSEAVEYRAGEIADAIEEGVSAPGDPNLCYRGGIRYGFLAPKNPV